MSDWHPSTKVLHADELVPKGFGTDPVSPAIYYTTTFRAEDAAEFADMSNRARHPGFYTRYGNPTHERAAAVVAALEGTETAMVTSSGMAAITLAVLGHLKAGDHAIAQTRHYMAAAKLFDEVLPRYGMETTVVEQTDLAAMEAAIRPNTKLIYVETPANPTLVITDLEAVAALGRKYQLATIADNTFSSPENTRPAALGIDVVVHSATKSLGGHHDVTAGVVCCSRATADMLWPLQLTLGATLSPMDAWLLLRGMRTLPVRMERMNGTALALAGWLEAQPQIARVYYPMLESHPQHALAKRQMRGGGPMVAFQVAGDYAATNRFVSALRLAGQAVSLGGVETLVVHTAAMWEGTMTPDQMAAAGISPNFVRLAVGLEHLDDLTRDFAAALKTVDAKGDAKDAKDGKDGTGVAGAKVNGSK